MTCGSLSARSKADATLSTMGRGVPPGATMPNQVATLKLGTPDSATVGTSGSCVERLALVTASGNTVPPRICPMMVIAFSNENVTSPASTACIAGGAPL